LADRDQSRVTAEARVVSVMLVLAAGTSLLIGSAVVISLFDEVGEAGAVLLRVMFAALVLLAIWRPSLRGHSPRAWRYVITFGVVVVGLNLAFFAAIDRAPLGIVSATAFTGPLAVAIAASRRVTDLLWVAMAALGVLLFSPLGGGALDALALALSLLTAVGWASYILVSARVGQAFTGGHGLALAMAVGTLVILPGGIVSGGSELLRPEVLAVGAAVAILSSVIPYTLEMEALRRLDTGTFGILVSLQPAIAALVGLAVLKQDLSATEVLAVGLVVFASIGALGRARAPTPIEA
jgi:inner membrane transporter RhtA